MSRRYTLLLPSNRIKLFYLSFQRRQSLMIGSELTHSPVQAIANVQYRFIIMQRLAQRAKSGRCFTSQQVSAKIVLTDR
jgi:hypothetical protein